MRAVTVSEYGGTPVVAEIPTPEPGAGQVLLRMRAAGMNPMDATLASGAWRPAPATFPMVLGADGAGVVERAGEGARRFSRGDELFGQLLIAPLGSAGTYAEYVAVTEEAPLARVPDGLDPVVAAALPTAGGTGLALVASLEPLAGKTVLIVGAGGGVGSFATQFAVNAGARVIASVHAAAAGRMRGYGAAETVDHTEVSLPAHYAGHIRTVSMSSSIWSATRMASPRLPRSSGRAAPPSRRNTSPIPAHSPPPGSPGPTSTSRSMCRASSWNRLPAPWSAGASPRRRSPASPWSKRPLP
jgi:NADPH:quinone reductase-like Zn-dependent oxidoreductase